MAVSPCESAPVLAPAVVAIGSLVVSPSAGAWDPSFSYGSKRLDSVELGGRPDSVGMARGRGKGTRSPILKVVGIPQSDGMAISYAFGLIFRRIQKGPAARG